MGILYKFYLKISYNFSLVFKDLINKKNSNSISESKYRSLMNLFYIQYNNKLLY